MKRIATPWEKLSKVFLLYLGLPLLLLGGIFVAITSNYALFLNGIVWTLLGAGSFIVSALGRQTIETLKKEGICYQAEVVSITPSLWIRVGSFVTARLECVVKTEKGDMRFRSGYFLLSPFDKKENLLATIYIDALNFERFSIELFRAQGD